MSQRPGPQPEKGVHSMALGGMGEGFSRPSQPSPEMWPPLEGVTRSVSMVCVCQGAL